MGIVGQSSGTANLMDFQKLAPRSALLQNNFSGYDADRGFTVLGSSFFSFNAGLNFADKQRNYYRPDPQLRIGFSMMTGNGLTGGLHDKVKKPLDTIVSPTGQLIPRDSVSSTHYSMDYTTKQFRVDASLIFRTNRMKRFSLYAGLGANFGFALGAYTDITYINSKYIEEEHPANGHGSGTPYPRKDSTVTEHFNNKKGMGFCFYIPAGIDFRLGRRRDFWKKAHLFSESRFVLNYYNIPELRWARSVGFVSILGVRWAVD
jgi:hypothetical protein